MDEGFVRGLGDRRVREFDGIDGIGAVRADLVAGCGGWWLKLDPGEGFAYSSELTRVVAAVGRSVVLGVHDVTVYPVILFMEGDGGRSFQGKEPPPSQVRKFTLAVRFAMGPISVETDSAAGVE